MQVDRAGKFHIQFAVIRERLTGCSVSSGCILPVVEDQHMLAIDARWRRLIDDEGAAGRWRPDSSAANQGAWYQNACRRRGDAKRAPAATAVWMRPGARSMGLSTRTPCQWMAVGSGSSLIRRTHNSTPRLTRKSGPGETPW